MNEAVDATIAALAKAAESQLIYDRLSSMDKLDVLLDLQPPKNWQTSRDGGPRKIVREDLRLLEEEE